MAERNSLAERFEDNRSHLRSVAYRMLGSLTEADDAVQEAWFRLDRADMSAVENLKGWLTTVVARLCLDMLRTRTTRREDSLDAAVPGSIPNRSAGTDPGEEAVLADSVGLALLVVLNTLSPPERIAFVLHDMFAVPFDEIASILDRSPTATRQLASRARRRVQGADTVKDADLGRQRKVVDAFLRAARQGDFEALLAVLAPEVVYRDNREHLPEGALAELHGATAVATMGMKSGARAARAALVNGRAGVVIAPRGRLLLVLDLTFTDGQISAIELLAGPDRLRQLELAVLPD